MIQRIRNSENQVLLLPPSCLGTRLYFPPLTLTHYLTCALTYHSSTPLTSHTHTPLTCHTSHLPHSHIPLTLMECVFHTLLSPRSLSINCTLTHHLPPMHTHLPHFTHCSPTPTHLPPSHATHLPPWHTAHLPHSHTAHLPHSHAYVHMCTHTIHIMYNTYMHSHAHTNTQSHLELFWGDRNAESQWSGDWGWRWPQVGHNVIWMSCDHHHSQVMVIKSLLTCSATSHEWGLEWDERKMIEIHPYWKTLNICMITAWALCFSVTFQKWQSLVQDCT